MDLIYGFGLGMVVGSGITFLVNVVFSPSEPKKKGAAGVYDPRPISNIK